MNSWRWLIAVLITLDACAAHAAQLAGHWIGVWTRNGDTLPVTLHFTAAADGALSGSFDSDALQVAHIPLSDVRQSGDQVHFAARGDQSTTVFDATLTTDRATGQFTDGSVRGTFNMQRLTQPPPSVRTRDVAFENGDVRLGGSLLLPAGRGRHPAIVFLQGSGPETRFANFYLAQKFAEAGFVALIFDKRGTGQSGGDWKTAGFEEIADDAAAGVRLLRRQPEVDPARVGIYGHSQGGTIAPLVALRSGGAAFVIASAAGGVAPAEVETYSLDNGIGVQRLPSSEQADARAFVAGLIAVGYRGADPSTLATLAARYRGRSWFFEPPPANDYYWGFARRIARYDPSAFWTRVRAPVLLVYGLHDERVPPRPSIAAIRAALKRGGNRAVTERLYPRADHTFTIVEPAAGPGWPKHEPAYAADLIAWARGKAGAVASGRKAH